MNEAILFLIESSVILGVFYSIYYALLRKEASFNFNRFYLLGAMLISLVLPLLSANVLALGTPVVNQPIKQLSELRSDYRETVEEWSYGIIDQDFASSSTGIVRKDKDAGLVLKVILAIYGVGLVAMIFRMIWTIAWITKLRMRHPKTTVGGVTVISLPYRLAPFSFLNSVFVPEEMLESEELSHILEHEKTHIRQRHSFDLLIVQLLTAILWFNPVVWWINKSLKTTHEYIADRHMIKQGYSLVEYQTLLLRQLISNNSFGLVHNFNLSFIKKRITMMNIQKLGGLGKFKVAAVITMTVLLSLVIVQCNSKLDSQNLALVDDTVVGLPVIETQYSYDIKEDLRFDITIKNDQVYFKDGLITLEGLASFDGDFPRRAEMVLSVDKNQNMKLVHEVQQVLREKDLRKLMYMGENESGELIAIPFMLPPFKNSKSGITVPTLTPEFIAENGIHMLELDMNVKNVSYDAFAYNSLNDPMIPKASLVIRGSYTDDTSYGDYLTGLNQIKNGFYRYYDERAQELFGKSFFQISRERFEGEEEASEQYRKAREGVPMSITFQKI